MIEQNSCRAPGSQRSIASFTRLCLSPLFLHNRPRSWIWKLQIRSMKTEFSLQMYTDSLVFLLVRNLMVTSLLLFIYELRARHPNWGEHNSQASMVGQRVVFRPLPFLHFSRKKDCILHTEPNCLHCVSDLIAAILTTMFRLFWPHQVPYSLLQWYLHKREQILDKWLIDWFN